MILPTAGLSHRAVACVRCSQVPAGAPLADPSAAQPATPSTTPVLEEETETRTAHDRPWNVVVWDDPINLMSYVVFVFQKLFGFTREKATKHMLEVHHQGRSIVATEDREKAEYYVTRLHLFGLQATMEQVSG